MISERIKELRIKKGITQQEVADFAGVSKQTISKFENGIKAPSRETTIKLSEFFNVTSDYLLGISDTQENLFGEFEKIVQDAKSLDTKDQKTVINVMKELIKNLKKDTE